MRWIFWGAAGLVFYTYLGYAAWLWLRARFQSWPVQRGAQEPFLSIVMVVRNEEQVLEEKMRNLLDLDYPRDRIQIVVVSDGSTDRTPEILRSFARDSRIHVLLNQLAGGKANGINDAMGLAQGEIVVFTDARQRIDHGALRPLIEAFADAEVGCVSGELMLGDPESGESANGMGLYWQVEKTIRELEAQSGSAVGATGALYAVRRELIPELPGGTVLDDVYIPMEVVRRGKRVIFEPRARVWDVPFQGADREFGRKVRTLSGNYQLVQLSPWLLSGSNPIRLEFISHKLLRLIVPFALAAMLISSFLLPGQIYRITLVLQILFYSLSLFAGFRLSLGPMTRMADAALTFVVLNTAAAVAFMRFITGRKVVWIR
ncbi:MAG TPA: glycosyltransferase family 2 protein [Verrucomicrobiae bacterium]|jgi:poly-beta-1,6-N-acetyl-D-glucosamine synthase|nr:glycosyltransferase family 2 protein [Verrucomicrobiae bacterium]